MSARNSLGSRSLALRVSCGVPHARGKEGSAISDDPAVTDPDVYLTYSFYHNLSDLQLGTAPEFSRWSHWYSRFTTKDFEITLDHSYSLIPPIRAVLHPETFGVDHETSLRLGLPAVGTIQEMRRAMRPGVNGSQADETYLHRGLRLTWSTPAAWRDGPIEMTIHNGPLTASYRFTVAWADALLLPDNVGILLVKLSPEVATLAALAEFSRHIKKILFRRRLTVPLPEFRLYDGSESSWNEIQKSLLADLSQGAPPVDRTLQSSEFAETQGVNWQLLCAAGVEAEPCDSLFQSPLERAAFSIAVGRSPQEMSNLPTPHFLKGLRESNAVSLWDSWYALYHYDNLLFIADVSTDSKAAEYQGHREIFEHEYLALACVAFAQDAALDALIAELGTLSGSGHDTLQRLDELERRFARFNTRLWFPQVGTTPVGQPLYKMLHSGAGLSGVHGQVYSDIRRLRGHLEERQMRVQAAGTRRNEALLQFLTVFLLPFTAYVTLFQPTLLAGHTVSRLSSTQAWLGASALTLVSTAVWTFLRFRGRRQDEEF